MGGICKDCHFRDYLSEYCFRKYSSRLLEIEQIKKGLIGECEFYKENKSPLLGELEESKRLKEQER